MKSKITVRPNRKSRWLRGLAILVGIPLLILLVAVAAFGYRELHAAQWVRAEIDRLRAAGEPVDNESMAVWFRKHTSPEGTVDWNEILSITASPVNWELASHLPFVGTGKIPNDLAQGGDWPQALQVTEYLAEMKPVIARIQAATKHPAPVWEPMKFDGFGTLLAELQDSRSIIRLLELDVEHALYQKDTPRALQSLTAMKGVCDAFDWDICLVSEYIHIALKGMHWSAICRSLGTGLWDISQIGELMEQVDKSSDVASRWSAAFAGERAMFLASIGDPAVTARQSPTEQFPFLLFSIPSFKQKYLEDMRERQQLSAKGLFKLSKLAGELDERRGRGGDTFMDLGRLTNNLFQPALVATASVFEREELSRRFTITALGVKRFQLEQGHWPQQLSELASVGLGPNEWNTLYAGSFGYRIDGDHTILWGYEPDKDKRVSDIAPSIEFGPEEEMPWYVVVIR